MKAAFPAAFVAKFRQLLSLLNVLRNWCLLAREEIHGVTVEVVPCHAIMSERVSRAVESKSFHQVGYVAHHACNKPSVWALVMGGDSFECGGGFAVHFHKSNLAKVTGG